MVGPAGFEPAASSSRTRRSHQVELRSDVTTAGLELAPDHARMRWKRASQAQRNPMPRCIRNLLVRGSPRASCPGSASQPPVRHGDPFVSFSGCPSNLGHVVDGAEGETRTPTARPRSARARGGGPRRRAAPRWPSGARRDVYRALGPLVPSLRRWSPRMESNHRPLACRASDLPLSDSESWSTQEGSNLRPPAYQADALPLSYAWWLARPDSNRRPRPSQGRALPLRHGPIMMPVGGRSRRPPNDRCTRRAARRVE